MRSRILDVLVAGALVGGTALAQSESGFTLNGTAGLGGLFTGTSDTVDRAKLEEYRDLSDGVLTLLELEGRGNDYHLDLFAGSGTTGAVASALGREAVLVDDNPEAVRIMAARMPHAEVRRA